MTTLWIIGLILSASGILLLKDTEFISTGPTLRVWNLVLFIIAAMIPILNIILGIAIITFWSVSTYLVGNCTYTNNSKIIRFLNKPVKF